MKTSLVSIERGQARRRLRHKKICAQRILQPITHHYNLICARRILHLFPLSPSPFPLKKFSSKMFEKSSPYILKCDIL